MFNCFEIFCNWVNPDPMEIPSIKNLVLKPFEAPPKQVIPTSMESWNIL